MLGLEAGVNEKPSFRSEKGKQRGNRGKSSKKLGAE
jgi:hypothetical protein